MNTSEITFDRVTLTFTTRSNRSILTFFKIKVENMSQMLNDPGLTRMALPDEDSFEERTTIEDIEDGDKRVILEMLFGEH